MTATCPGCPGHLPSLCGDGVSPCARGLELAEQAAKKARESALAEALDILRAEAERAKKLIEERVAANLEDHAREIEKVRAEERAKWRELAKALDSEPVFRPGPAAYARGYSSAIASVRAQLKQMGVLP